MHGLGLTADEFWSMTPRELAAHRALVDDERDYLHGLYAGLQATLHNAHWVRQKGQKPFTADMFMPGYEPESRPDESWRSVKAQAMAMQPMTKEQRRDMVQHKTEFDDRAQRATVAKAGGASREEIMSIMEGK